MVTQEKTTTGLDILHHHLCDLTICKAQSVYYPLVCSMPLCPYIPQPCNLTFRFFTNVITVPSARTTSANEQVHTDRIRLINAEADEPNTPSNSKAAEDITTMEQLGEETAKELGPVLEQIMQDLINCSTLKVHQNNAEQEFNKRSAEFKASENLHEKFPAMAETQTRSKARAESSLNAITEKVGVIESSLNSLATQSVAQIIPRILAATHRERQEPQWKESQLRAEELARNCEDFRKQLEDAQKHSKAQELLVENLKKSHDEKNRSFEDRFGAFHKRFEELQKRSETQEHLMNDLQKSHGELQKSNNELHKSHEQLEGMFSKLSDECQRLKVEESRAILALEARLDKVATQMSDENKLSGTLSELQRDVYKLDNRLRVAETQKSSIPPTPPLDSAALSIISQLDNKTIPALGASVSRITARCSALEETLSALQKWKEGQDGNPAISGVRDTPMDYETLKREILEVADDKQSAADEVTSQVFTQLWTAVGENENRLKAVERSSADMKTTYGPLVALPEQVQQLTASLAQRDKQQVDETTTNVLDSIRLRPERLPLEAIESQILKGIEAKLEPVSKAVFHSVNDKLEAHTDGINALERRLNNINTRNMAMFIIGQIESLYPDVRNVQDFISDHRANFNRVEVSLKDTTGILNTVQTQVGALEGRISKTSSSDNILQSIRGELDTLTRTVSKIQGAASSAKLISDTTKEEVIAAKNNNTKFQEDIAGEMGSFRIDLEEVKTAVQNIKAKAILSARDRSSVALPSRSVSASTATGPAQATSGRFESPNAQPFASGSQGNKKRKLNGAPPSAATGTLQTPNGSSKKKKKKKQLTVDKVEEHDSEGSNFEPRRPTISDEDEI